MECVSELRSRVNREVGPGSHSLSHSSPVPSIVVSHAISVDVKHREKRGRNKQRERPGLTRAVHTGFVFGLNA